MRFVSKYPRLGLGTVIAEEFALVGYNTSGPQGVVGNYQKVRDSVYVQFEQHGLLETDIKFALNHWAEKEFTGRWLDADEVTQQPIAERIGVFDTDDAAAEHKWTPEIKAEVERWMLAKPNYGVDFVLVEKIPVAKPWPSYDSAHHNKIAVLALELGLVDEALAYERDNKNRPAVIEALETAKAKPSDSVEGDLIAA